MIVGFSLSVTVTVNVQFVELPPASIAVQVTGLVPFGNVELLAGLQLTVTFVQLSLAVGVA